MKKEIIKNRRGQKIVVIVEEAEKQKGLVFVMHGLGGFKEQPHIQTMAEAFNEKEYTVIRFDTTNSIGESEGKLELATLTNYYEDLEDVIEWAKKQRWYQQPFCLAGHSLGGFCVAWHALNHPDEVKAIAPISSFISGEIFIKTLGTKESIEDWEKGGYREWKSSSYPGLVKKLNWSFVPDALKYDLLTKAEEIKVPVLIIVGDQDTDTRQEHLKILYEKLTTKKELHIIKGAPHTFKENAHLREIKNIFLNWIDSL
ncbi:MAG: alpha/beta hydrolase [bacterium]